MKPEFTISVMDDGQDREDGFMEVVLFLSNGASAGTQQCFIQRDRFIDFGDQMANFPVDINSVVSIEAGGRGGQWATYLLLEVFCYDRSGHSAIKVIMENYSAVPNCDKVEFYVNWDVAALNRLGTALASWRPVTGENFEWNVELG